MTKALTYEDIQQRVQAHSFALVTTKEEWLNGRGRHITVRSASGYEQVRRIDTFAPGAVQATCQYDRTTRKGETLAVPASSALLGTTLIREYTPRVLKGPGYRLDGWAELRGPNGEIIFLALEHQGDHRTNPDAPVHLKRGGAEVSMKDQADRDADKLRLLKTDPRIVPVFVPDLMLATDREQGVVEIVANALEAQMPWLLHERAYTALKAGILERIAAGERVLRLPQSWTQESSERVKEALRATGDHERLRFVDADPLRRTVTLACAIHGVLQPVNINNVLGSADGQRKGTRCARCVHEAFGDSRRLSHSQVVAIAREAGFEPLFADGEYSSNQQKLMWRCLTDATHVVEDTLAHIVERGCPYCRSKARADDRCASEFAEVSSLIIERGDTLLSTPDEYQNQDSRIRYRCSLCDKEAAQAAVKIKRGQRHGCQRLSSSQATRRSREFERLAEIVKILGIELQTTAATYAGNRKAVLYRKPGVAEVQSAPAYRLRIWATNAREQVA
jgi:hypothetical protein